MKKLLIIFLFLCLPLWAQLLPADKPMFGQQIDWSNPISDGLVGYWPFVEAGNLVDFSPYGNDGVITGATWVGEGLSFNGTTNYTRIPFDGTDINKFTYLLWVRPAAASTNNMIIEYTDNAATGGFYFYYTSNYVLAYNESVGSGVNSRTRTSILTPGEWTQIAAVVDFTLSSGEATTYKDGLLDSTIVIDGDNPATGLPPNDFLNVGARDGSSLFFAGDIKSISIFSRALSASEIQSLYQTPNQLIRYDPIWMFLPGEEPGGSVGSIFNSPIFGGSVVR